MTDTILDTISAAGYPHLAERLRRLLGSGGSPLAKLQRIEAVRDSFESAYDLMLDVAPERQSELIMLRTELLIALESETLDAIGQRKARKVA